MLSQALRILLLSCLLLLGWTVVLTGFVYADESGRGLDQGSAPATEEESEAQRQSRLLREQGNQAMEALRYPQAVQAYEAARRAYPDPALRYNLGRAHQALGNFPRALDEILAFQREATPELLARIPALNELTEELRSQVATLIVTSNLRGATVTVDDRPVGVTPTARVRLSAGRAHLEVTAKGHTPFSRHLLLRGGETTTVSVGLEPIERSGFLRVKVPAGVDVFANGVHIGKGPCEAPVEPGRLQVVGRQPKHKEARATLVIAAGETRDVELSPEARPSVLEHWAFWAGAAVLVAGGATTAALLLEQKADQGAYFKPSQIEAPLTIGF